MPFLVVLDVPFAGCGHVAELPVLAETLVHVLGEEVFDEGREHADVASGVDEAMRGGGWKNLRFEHEGVFRGGGYLSVSKRL